MSTDSWWHAAPKSSRESSAETWVASSLRKTDELELLKHMEQLAVECQNPAVYGQECRGSDHDFTREGGSRSVPPGARYVQSEGSRGTTRTLRGARIPGLSPVVSGGLKLQESLPRHLSWSMLRTSRYPQGVSWQAGLFQVMTAVAAKVTKASRMEKMKTMITCYTNSYYGTRGRHQPTQI